MKKTCGIYLLNKYNELLIVHPTYGPKKNSWSIPKGEPEEYEEFDSLSTAIREFYEETGITITKEVYYLGENEYLSGRKTLTAYFIKDEDMEREKIVCESKRIINNKLLPENDKYLWISVTKDKDRLINKYLHESQIIFIDDIIDLIEPDIETINFEDLI